jgi:hypothetical protein
MLQLSPRAAGGIPPQAGRGVHSRAALAPSTMLRMVPLPRFAGEEPAKMRYSGRGEPPEKREA